LNFLSTLCDFLCNIAHKFKKINYLYRATVILPDIIPNPLYIFLLLMKIIEKIKAEAR